MNTTDITVQVRITSDGACFIDNEFFAPPPGTLLNQAVLAHLSLEAAALGSPVRAVICDEQAGYSLAICVNPDGSSQPMEEGSAALGEPIAGQASQVASKPTSGPSTEAGSVTSSALLPQAPRADEEPVPPERPYEPLPEPFRTRLADICSTARQDRFQEAAGAADQLIAELVTEYGPTHLYTLAAGFVRGDIAWLMRDHRYGLQSWTFMARAWHRLLGPAHQTTALALGNALACWLRLPDPEALEASDEITALLREARVTGIETLENHVGRRLDSLSAQARHPKEMVL